LAYRRARLLIVASDSLAEELRAGRLPPERVRVVPPGRDVAEPPAGRPPDLRHGRRAAFLCVANWIQRKGILELLEAFARLPVGAATLHLAGETEVDTAYASRVTARLSGADLRGRVVVHGAVPRERVAELYAGADVFALPAYREPYGTVWGEAMAAGLPIAGWRAGNLPYLAQDGVEALMVTPGDGRALSAALERLALDESLRGRMGEAARRRALSRPTWEESARMFFAAVREAIGTR
jgi:glycosyltransferase involved in cell wall biosynthesis